MCRPRPARGGSPFGLWAWCRVWRPPTRAHPRPQAPSYYVACSRCRWRPRRRRRCVGGEVCVQSRDVSNGFNFDRTRPPDLNSGSPPTLLYPLSQFRDAIDQFKDSFRKTAVAKLGACRPFRFCFRFCVFATKRPRRPPPAPSPPGIDGLAVYNSTYAPATGNVVCYVDPETGGVTGVSASGSRACPGVAVNVPVGGGRVTGVKVAFSPKDYVSGGGRRVGGCTRGGKATSTDFSTSNLTLP